MTFLGSNDPITCTGTYIKPNITIIHQTFTVIYQKIDLGRQKWLVYYGDIWFNTGPDACNWIIGTQESHEYAIQRGWTSNMTVWCKNETPHIAISVIQSQFSGKLQ